MRALAAHIGAMISRKQWRWFFDRPVVQWTIFAVGVLLMIASIPIGALPGPGGIVVFAVGLAMVLRTSMWAKRHYVRFKRWQPKAGRWADWGLRRQSARRREALHKDRKAILSPARGREATPPPAPADASPKSSSDPRDN